jgi:uncharacterized protein (DUF427 family)
MPHARIAKPVIQPGRAHSITIEPNPSRVVVRAGGAVVADTIRALTLREGALPAVQYIPLADVDRSLLTSTDHATYCPFKGDASYYSITGAEDGEDAVWEYREPHPAVAEIRGHVAFYANRVQLSEEPAAA